MRTSPALIRATYPHPSRQRTESDSFAKSRARNVEIPASNYPKTNGQSPDDIVD
ncbi:hypothetical protein X777_09517 [Ooceraea biroi]|uniref:Uncharacterized protein n=1 Tax=Ooceraea biroi TaxID=2015173 RepID=A0A026W6S3_OOCBI|nr:hypothetical protein X777_09517 [Ooceraea biroi]